MVGVRGGDLLTGGNCVELVLGLLIGDSIVVMGNSDSRITLPGDAEFGSERCLGDLMCNVVFFGDFSFNGELGLVPAALANGSDSLNSGGGGMLCLRGELMDFFVPASATSLLKGSSRLGSRSKGGALGTDACWSKFM